MNQQSEQRILLGERGSWSLGKSSSHGLYVNYQSSTTEHKNQRIRCVNFAIPVHTEAKIEKGNEDQETAFAEGLVQEAKVAHHHVIDGGNGVKLRRLVEKEQRRKRHQVNRLAGAANHGVAGEKIAVRLH